MLQKIEGLDWQTPRLGGWEDGLMQPANYDGDTIFVGPKDAPKFYVSLPPGVVLAREVPAPADPYMCPTCHGAGLINVDVNYDIREEPCDTCGARGRLYKRSKAKGT